MEGNKKDTSVNEAVAMKCLRQQRKLETQKGGWEERKTRRKLEEEEQRKRYEATFRTEWEKRYAISYQYLSVTADWNLPKNPTVVKKEEPEEENGIFETGDSIITLEEDEDESKSGQVDPTRDANSCPRMADSTAKDQIAIKNVSGLAICRSEKEEKDAVNEELNEQRKQENLKIKELVERTEVLKDLQISNGDGTTKVDACVTSSSSPTGGSDSNGEGCVQLVHLKNTSISSEVIASAPVAKDSCVISKVHRRGSSQDSSRRSKPNRRPCLVPKSFGDSAPPDCRRTQSQNIQNVSVRNGFGDAVKKNNNGNSNREGIQSFLRLEHRNIPGSKQTLDGFRSNAEKGDCVKPQAYGAQLVGKVLLKESQSMNPEDTKRRNRTGRSPLSLRKEGHVSNQLKTTPRKCVKRIIKNPKVQHKKVLHKCGVCGKVFVSQYRLIRHMRTHTGEKPFECDTCNVKFSRLDHLQIHRRVHTGEKPFECDVCRKNFSRSGNFKLHQRTHTGERPFQCDICPKKFASSSDIRKHQRTHTGEKPYECPFCHKRFSTSGYLNVHKRIHTGE